MTNEIEPGLDAIQLAALRKCDDVVFCHRDGVSYIRAVKRVRPSDAEPFAQDVAVEFPCETRWTDYSREWCIAYPVPQFAGFEMVGNYTDGTWRTIAHALRKGDVLCLHWMKDCMGKDSDLCRAGLTLDRLELVVMRGANKLTFHLDDKVMHADSLARMIKNVRPAPEYALA
jgi:hypothetical protein